MIVGEPHHFRYGGRMLRPMSLSIAKTGLRQYENNEILLLGGYARNGLSPEGTMGAGFAVFDAPRLRAGDPADVAMLGDVELFLLQPRLSLFHGLANITVRPSLRRRGIGRRIVQAIAATTPDFQLKIYDIGQDAVPFWMRLGCSFRPRQPTWDAHYRLSPALQPEEAAETIAPPPYRYLG